MKIRALIELTFRESLAKKTFIGFMAISTLTLLLLIFALSLDIVDGAQSAISVFGLQSQSLIGLTDVIVAIESVIAVLLYSGGIFLSLFATSNLIPGLLQPGFIDLFISKPVSRLTILSGRFLGSIAIVAFNIFYLVAGTWLVLSLKTEIWNPDFLLSGLMIVLSFTSLFTLMMFFGLITGSGPLALMITYIIFFFSPLLLQRDQIYALLSSAFYGYLLDGLYYFLPKTAEMLAMTEQLVRGVPVAGWMPLWSSLLFGLFMFLISSFVFARKNF